MPLRSFFEWFEQADTGLPWLILGKGPSYSKRDEFDLSGFATISLNHVVREQRVTVAHVIDLDVVDDCADAICANADFLVMPWQPHVKNSPGSDDLARITGQHVVLGRLAAEGRLLWYNLSTGRAREGSPIVHARYFSAEAALNLLAAARVRKIRTLGVDGGASYSPTFTDLTGKTLLANGRSSFDRQFGEFASTICRTGIDFAPLDMQSPIKVFVAATDAQMLAVKVLEYSIRRNTSMSVEVMPLHQALIPFALPRAVENQPRTPFSFQRFLIPQLMGYQGRAIYMDSDMQVFGDLRRLWALPFDGADLLAVREPSGTGRRPQFSVMLMNCEILRWNILEIIEELDAGKLTYQQLMYEMKVANNIRAGIEPAWNSLERYTEGETALLHYTDMQTQPWLDVTNPLGYLWFQCLFEAIDAGFITQPFILEEIRRGHVRPSVAYQIESRLEDSLLLPRSAQALDGGFIPLHEGGTSERRSTFRGMARKLKAFARMHYQRAGLKRLEQRIRGRFSR